MGVVFLTVMIGGPKSSESVEFLVDTGANYTLLPQKIWRKIGLKPDSSETFRLADGTAIERKMSECLVTYDGRQRHTPVVLGEKEDQALFGVITLEEFGLVVNPFTRKIQPMRMMLA